MSYVFRGNLCGYLCADCWEALSQARVRLYRLDERSNAAALAVADPKDTFAILDEDAITAKQPRLLAEADTDVDGNFTFEFGDDYKGEAFEIDVYCESVLRQKSTRRPKARQFTITTLQPRFRETDAGYLAVWRYCIPWRFWCQFLSLFDVWTICGHVTVCESGRPVTGVNVLAFDADWIEDDPVGSATTDGSGHFLITYTSTDFKQGTWLDVELIGGPDLFFRVEDSGGSVLLAEPRSRGRDPDRENAGNCFCVSLCVEQAPVVCDLTAPTGCTAEEPDTSAGILTITAVGTASGAGFGSYVLEVLESGSPVAGVSVQYPGGGATGTIPVVAGSLGEINTTALMDGDYTVRLTVSPSGAGTPAVCERTFTLLKILVFMNKVGQIMADPDPISESAELRAGGIDKSVGGVLSIDGAAYVYGCVDRQIKRYDIRTQRVMAPGSEPAQPATDDPVPAGWSTIPPLPLEYTLADQYQPWTRIGPAPRDLVNTWKTFTVGATTYYALKDGVWSSSESGRFSLLMVVEDSTVPTPHRYYDIQHIWLDNKQISGTVKIVKFQRDVDGVWTDISPCQDLLVSFGKVRIVGLAWDPIIDETWWPPVVPNDNFAYYNLHFWKQFGPSHLLLGNTTTRVPALPAAPPVIAPTDADADELAQWDLSTLDAGPPPDPFVSAPDPKIYRGDSCTYNVQLFATDSTAVNDNGSTHFDFDTVPVKVVNDL